jgi:hypothetical protein
MGTPPDITGLNLEAGLPIIILSEAEGYGQDRGIPEGVKAPARQLWLPGFCPFFIAPRGVSGNAGFLSSTVF